MGGITEIWTRIVALFLTTEMLSNQMTVMMKRPEFELWLDSPNPKLEKRLYIPFVFIMPLFLVNHISHLGSTKDGQLQIKKTILM